MKRLIATATAMIALGAAVPAQAALDMRTINTEEPGVPTLPAFFGAETIPANKALYAGTCDLNSASTTNGGVGAHNGGIAPPAIRAHCIDVGLHYENANLPWEVGKEPRWRLDPVTQAGAHPDASAAFWFRQTSVGGVDGTVKNIVVKLPPGVVGSPTATPQCSALDLQSVPNTCDARTQVGINSIGFTEGAAGGALSGQEYKGGIQTYGVYNVEARDTVTAEFFINGVSGLFNIPITARGRTNSDYGVDTLALLIPEFATFSGQAFTFWGVPWAAEHDKFRIEASKQKNAAWRIHENGFAGQGYTTIPYHSSWGPIKPFFTNPTECDGLKDEVLIELDSYQDPVSNGGSWTPTTTFAPAAEGCDQLEFDPSMQLRPDVQVADSPSGLDVLLTTPQNNDAPDAIAHDPADDVGAPAHWRTTAGLGTAHLKDTVVKLPQGTSFNPAAANGLLGCSTAQIGLTATEPNITFNNDPQQCPDESKIGTLEIISPLLPDPLRGDVYAAPQNDNPFPGTLTAIYLVAQDEERGLSVKLAGKVDLDPKTGQIATTFVDNPQLPINSFELHFETGPRAPLNTPATCGQFENSSDLIPWSFPDSGPQPTIHDPFPISEMPNGFGCVTEPEDRGFAPGFEAGTTSVQAGGDTNFVLNVTRRDGEQEVSGISLDMAPGVVGDLSKTPYCPEASIAAARVRSGQEETASPSCPTASYIGQVNTLAGAGPLPLPTPGRLYLSGPYDADGAGPAPLSPLSVTTIVPAIAGGVPGDPAFDLGNVVIRTGINVDPATARVHIDSTDVPYIVGGIPLRIRSVAVDLDKPSFMRNPTNCTELAMQGGLRGAADPLDPTDDILANVANRFQVGNCEALGFKPRLQLRLKGGTKRTANPRLIATLNARPGDANIARTQVTMPRSAFLDQSHIRTICTRVQWAQDNCPQGSIYGYAEAVTPLLADPIKGAVYLRSSSNLLPDLVADLRGPAHQPIRIELVGRTDSFKGALRNTFDVIPDAPVSRFTLRLRGGKRGLIVNSKNICQGTHRATIRMAAQNGRSQVLRPKLANDCKAQRKNKRNSKRAKR